MGSREGTGLYRGFRSHGGLRLRVSGQRMLKPTSPGAPTHKMGLQSKLGFGVPYLKEPL